MNNNKWLLVLEDDLNNKGEKKYIELNNDVDEFTLIENILMDLYENYNIDITCEEYLSKNIPKDIYKRRIMNINEIGFIIRGNFDDSFNITKKIESYNKVKKINLSDLYNMNEKIDLNYWILKLTEHGISSRNHIYFKIPSNITYNYIFKNIINIIEIYNHHFKLNDEVYSDYITLEQIKNTVINLFGYKVIEPINMLRDDNEYNNRIKIMNLSTINGREIGKGVEKHIDIKAIKNSDVYFKRIDGKAEVRDRDSSNPIEDVIFPDDFIIKNEMNKIIRETKNKFDKYNIVANGNLIKLVIGKEKNIYVRDEESVKKIDDLFLLAPSNESINNIFCYMVYIVEIYNFLTSKTIKAPLMQVLLEKVFGLKILNKSDEISRKVIASEYYSDYTCQTSIKELIKYANNYKDNLIVNKRNKDKDMKMISEIINIKK